MKLSEKIRQQRAKLQISATELSTLSGQSKSYISAIENGHNTNPHLSAIREIAKVLGVNPAFLVNEHQDTHLNEIDQVINLYSKLDLNQRQKFFDLLEILIK